MLSLQRLNEILSSLPGQTIALVGDLFLDRYLDIDPDLRELSVETGLEAYQVTQIRNSPGALGTVLQNLAALGVGRLVPVTVVGDDGQAYDLLKELRRLPVETRHILKDPHRRTPTYTKPMQRAEDGTWRELNRLDLRNRAPLADETESLLLEHLSQAFHAADGLIVLDQVNEEGWGVVTPRVRQRLAELDQAAGGQKLIFVDSRARIGHFSCGVLKGNRSEFLASCSHHAPRDETHHAERDDYNMASVETAAEELSRRTGKPAFCTLGESGILVAQPGQDPHIVPGYPVTGPIDSVGAGDSATAGIVTALLAGSGPLEAAALGNLVAAITVQQLGVTGTASPDQLRKLAPVADAGR